MGAGDSHYRVKTAAELSNELATNQINEAELKMFRLLAGMPILSPYFTKFKQFIPSIFDRTFLLPVDIDHWRIDTDNTPPEVISQLQADGSIYGTDQTGYYLMHQTNIVQAANYGEELDTGQQISTHQEMLSFDQYYCYIELI